MWAQTAHCGNCKRDVFKYTKQQKWIQTATESWTFNLGLRLPLHAQAFEALRSQFVRETC